MSALKIRVLITDDHPVFRRALRYFLELDPAIEVVGEASSGEQACLLAQDSLAHVACVDWRMAAMDGVETIRRLIAATPDIKVIALSAGFEEGIEAAMLAAGASRYINKEQISDHLLPAIHALFSQREGDLAAPHAIGTPA